MWLVVSLTLARATFQIKLALVSRLYSWCLPGSLGHRAETSANKGPMESRALEPGLPPRICPNNKCQLAQFAAVPTSRRQPGAKGPMTKIFGTAMGE